MAIANKSIHELDALASPDGSEEVAVYDGVTQKRVTLTQVAGFTGAINLPASSTDNAIARWDGTGGDTLQDSGVTIDDDGIITLPENGDVKEDGEGRGLLQNVRNRYASGTYGFPLYGHFNSSVPTGFSWDTSIFTAPTSATYFETSYLNIAIGSSAFLQKSTSATTAYLLLRVLPFSEINIGARLDDGTNNNYAEAMVSYTTTGLSLILKSVIGGGAATTTTVVTGLSNAEFVTIALETNGTSRYRLYLINEFAGLAKMAEQSVTPFTPSRAGLVIYPQSAGLKSGYADWIAGDF